MLEGYYPKVETFADEVDGVIGNDASVQPSKTTTLQEDATPPKTS